MKWFVLFLAVILVSCSSNDKKISSDTDIPIVFRFNPETGRDYTYTTINESTSEQTVDEKDIDNETKLEIGITYKFEKDSLPGYQLTMQYNTFKLYAKALEQEKELDAATAANSFDPSDKMFAAFHNARLQAHMDTTGTVSNLSGIDEIREKMKTLAGNNFNAMQMLNGSIKEYISEAFFRQSVEGVFKTLSNRKLLVGDTIQSVSTVGGELNINANAIYKLVSVKNNTATIKLDADIDIKDQPLTIENTKVTAAIKGKQSGETKVNVLTGMTEFSETETNLKGTMQLLGREVPFKMKTRNRVNLLK